VLELMGDYIIGLKDLHALLVAGEKASKEKPGWIDLRSYPMSGVEVVDRYTYRVRIKGAYPQFPYWLAMPFFAPVPFEADRFFSQPGMAERNLTLDWWPVGTGPYMLQENNPNARMVLVSNPNYHGETYPCEGEEDDRRPAAGIAASRFPSSTRWCSRGRRRAFPTGTSFCRVITTPRACRPTTSTRRSRWGAG
jgi:hypothetical protein